MFVCLCSRWVALSAPCACGSCSFAHQLLLIACLSWLSQFGAHERIVCHLGSADRTAACRGFRHPLPAHSPTPSPAPPQVLTIAWFTRTLLVGQVTKTNAAELESTLAVEPLAFKPLKPFPPAPTLGDDGGLCPSSGTYGRGPSLKAAMDPDLVVPTRKDRDDLYGLSESQMSKFLGGWWSFMITDPLTGSTSHQAPSKTPHK